MEAREKKKLKIKTLKIIRSFRYAFEGFFTSLREERNMKIHIIVMLLVIILGALLKISKIEWMICILLFGIVIAGELFNTAIEAAVDLAMPHRHPKAKIAKDISAAAVLMLAISSAIIGIMIFLPKIIEIIKM